MLGLALAPATRSSTGSAFASSAVPSDGVPLGITTFEVSDDSTENEAFSSASSTSGSYVSLRYTSGVGGIRVSTHYFNDESDLDRSLTSSRAFEPELAAEAGSAAQRLQLSRGVSIPDSDVSPWLSSYTLALGALALVWVGVSAYVIVTRALFDLAGLSFHTARRVLDRRLARGASPQDALTRLAAADARRDRRRRVDPASDRGGRGTVACSLTGAVASSTRRGRTESDTDKWRRLAALRILSLAGSKIAKPELARALR